MSIKPICCLALFLLCLSGCLSVFTPAVRPEAATVILQPVIDEAAQARITAVFSQAAMETAAVTAVSTDGSATELKSTALADELAVTLAEGTWDIAVTAACKQYGILYSGTLAAIAVRVGEENKHTILLDQAVGDVKLHIDLTGLAANYRSPAITLKSPFDTVADRTASLDNAAAYVEFQAVPVGPWTAALQVETGENDTLTFHSSSMIVPQGQETIAIDVSIPLFSEYGALDLVIEHWGQAPPKAPINLTAEQVSNRRVQLTWDEPEHQLEQSVRYALYRKQAPADDPYYTLEPLADSILALEYRDSDDTELLFGSRYGLTYTYWVQAYYTAGTQSYASRLSEPAEITLTYTREDDPDVGEEEDDPVSVPEDDEPAIVDGITVDVTTEAELTAALAHEDVTTITLKADLSHDMVIDRALTVDFGSHTLTGHITVAAGVGPVKLLGSPTVPPDYHVVGTLTEGEGSSVEHNLRISPMTVNVHTASALQSALDTDYVGTIVFGADIVNDVVIERPVDLKN